MKRQRRRRTIRKIQADPRNPTKIRGGSARPDRLGELIEKAKQELK